MSMEREEMLEVAMRNLASDLATTVYIDGDFRHALLLYHEFRNVVEALLTLRKMREDGVVFIYKGNNKTWAITREVSVMVQGPIGTHTVAE